MSPLSVYLTSPYISIICIYSLPVYISFPYVLVHSMCLLCLYALTKGHLSVYICPLAVWAICLCVSRFGQYLSPLHMSPVFVCITPPCVSIPSPYGFSLCVYQVSVCNYALSEWVLSFVDIPSTCVSRLLPPPRAYQFFVCTAMDGMETRARSDRRHSQQAKLYVGRIEGNPE